MTIFTLILSIYSAVLVTFLFGRWVRMVILRGRMRRHLVEEVKPEVKQAFIASILPLIQVEAELDGDVVRGMEMEMERLERDEIEESIEEREWKEEQNLNQRLIRQVQG